MLQAEGHGEWLHLIGIVAVRTTVKDVKSHGKGGAFEDCLHDSLDANQLRGGAKILAHLEAIMGDPRQLRTFAVLQCPRCESFDPVMMKTGGCALASLSAGSAPGSGHSCTPPM